jgi:hypothetical protein
VDPTVVSQHDVLLGHECDRIRDQVLDLWKYWKIRSEAARFYTLGAASYLDAVDSRDEYLREARESNTILRVHFDWLWERIGVGFEKLLGEPVTLDHRCALPGFHIFILGGEDQTGDRPSSRAHFDLQWMHALPGVRPEETLSFTLLVEEPVGGSSMEIWPVHHDAICAGFDVLQYAASRPPQTIRYTRGRMVVHDGLLLHAIGRASVAKPKGRRITVQGHGAKISGTWRLYW